ncbi:MAG: sigma factor-like helix-turn-helix DNA-binding protein [candidate division WOR-3 bacterium]
MKGVRNEVMKLMKPEMTMAEIARRVGVTRERVRQIIRQVDKDFRSRAQIKLGERTCIGCGKKFRMRNRKQKYCSLVCVNRSRKIANK